MVTSPARTWSELDKEEAITFSTGRAARDGIPLSLEIADPQLWEPESPVLYDLELRVTRGDGAEADRVSSYAGLRETHIEGQPGVPQRHAPLPQAGARPGLLSGRHLDCSVGRRRCGATSSCPWPPASMGPDCTRRSSRSASSHWADRLGYLLWGESPSWGLDHLDEGAPHRNFLAEWREIVRRDRNHPSIIAWTPFNETWDIRDPRAHQRVHEDAYAICKSLDPTRPVNDASGYIHHVTDLYTVHSYEQDPAKLSEQLAPTSPGRRRRSVTIPDLGTRPMKGSPI